jgi:phage shock protein PspC (stress-responsive transcriptional regulator)
MNKVISINLNGNAYQLEEGGFEALRSYLDTANRRLEGNPDKVEIIADIEQAIADKFRSLLGVNKTVVVTKEVEAIIAEMGTVEDASGAPETPPPGAAAQPAGATAGADSTAGAAAAPKRLFKIHEGAMVGGVCNGLAAYLNVDVTLVRIVFALLMFAYGSGFLVYILMMILLPSARTPDEMAAAHGSTSATAKEFIRRAREGYYEGMKTFGDKRAHREWRRKFKREMRSWKWDFHHDMQQNAHRWWPGWGPQVPPRHPPGSMLAATLVSVLLIIATFVGLFAVVSLVSSGTVFGLLFFPSLPFWARILLLIAVISIVRSPLKAARRSLYYGQGYYDSGHGTLWCITKWVLIVYVIIWLCGGHTGLGEAVQHLPPKLHHAAESMQQWWNQQ